MGPFFHFSSAAENTNDTFQMYTSEPKNFKRDQLRRRLVGWNGSTQNPKAGKPPKIQENPERLPLVSSVRIPALHPKPSHSPVSPDRSILQQEILWPKLEVKNRESRSWFCVIPPPPISVSPIPVLHVPRFAFSQRTPLSSQPWHGRPARSSECGF